MEKTPEQIEKIARRLRKQFKEEGKSPEKKYEALRMEAVGFSNAIIDLKDEGIDTRKEFIEYFKEKWEVE